MPDEDFKILLHDYFDELLTPEEEADFQSLLMENRSIAIELGKLKDLKRRLKNMPLSFEPPPKIIQNITEKLLTLETVKEKNESKEKVRKAKKIKSKKTGVKKKNKALMNIILIIIVLTLGGGGGYYYYNINMNNSPWRIVNLSGEYKIANHSNSSNQINELQIFEQSEEAKSQIHIKDKGVIQINGKSKLEILTASQDLNTINFTYGNLEYIPKPNSSKFQIVKGGLIITSINSKFAIFSDELGDFNLEILSNFLEIEFKNETYRFAHDYVVKIEADNFIRTPYSNKTTPEFLKLLTDYDYNHEQTSLNEIINSASKNDALTLHFLLRKVTPTNRELIIDKLNSIIPFPYGVKKSDILILNQLMMSKWWDEIYSTIY